MRLAYQLLLMVSVTYFMVEAIAAEAISILVHDTAVVDGRIITLGDVATIRGKAATNIIDNLKAIPIIDAPLPGRTRRLHMKTIRAQIQIQSNIGKASLRIDGPAEMTISARGQILEKMVYLDLAQDFLRGKLSEYPNLELQLLGNYRDQILPPGKLNMDVTLLNEIPRQRQGVQVQLRCDDKLYTTIPIWFQLKGMISSPYARYELQQYQTLSDDVIEHRQQDVSQLRGLFPISSEKLRQSMASRAVRQGELLSIANVIPRMDVTEGSQVTVFVEAGNIKITTNAKAVETAARGAVVKLVSQSTNEIFHGMVVGPGLVRGI